MAVLLARTFIIYIVLILSMKLMGKRQVGELQLSELVTTLMLSELAVIPIADRTIPLLFAVFPILLLLSVEVIFSFAVTKINPLKKIIYDKPSFLIEHGKINQAEMTRLRVSLDELLSELRLKDAPDITAVDYAILEDNGKLTVIKKGYGGYVTPLIVDGVLQADSLPPNVTEAQINDALYRRSLKTESIFLMTLDENGRVTIIPKARKK